MQPYRERFIHLLYAVILAQFAIIALLVGGYSNQYLADDFFRGWVNNNYPWLGPLLQGRIDALLVGMALGGTVLIIQRVRGQEELRSVIQPLHTDEGSSSPDLDQRLTAPHRSLIMESKTETAGDVLAELDKTE